MMDHELAVVRLTIAGVLLTAALSKHERANGRQSAAPAFVNNLLRVAELVVACTLTPGSTARVGLLGATFLAMAFVVTLARDVSRGSLHGCGCFGSLDRDLSPLVSLFRACMLLALAAIGTVLSWNDASPDLWIWLGRHPVDAQAGIILGVSAVVVAAAVPGRIQAALSRLGHGAWGTVAFPPRASASGFPPAGPPVGSVAPSWREVLTGANDGRGVILIFESEASDDAHRRNPRCPGIRQVHVRVGSMSRLADLYQVRALPSALMLADDGVVLSRLAVGWAAIEKLCSQPVVQQREQTVMPLPQLVPDVARRCDPCVS